MAAPIKPGKSRHLHFDPYVRVKEGDSSSSINGDARVDKALKWIDSQPVGQRTKLVWELIIAAVNGELGVAPAVSMDDEDTAQNKSALDELLKNMVLDEE